MANGKKKVEAPTIIIDITPGEFYDRFAIVALKVDRVKDPIKQARAALAKHRLDKALEDCQVEKFSKEKLKDLEQLLKAMVAVHSRLWETENEVRQHEEERDFGSFFVRAARRVYKLNDERSSIKNRIDALFGHDPEVKEFTPRGEEEEKDDGTFVA